MCVCCHDLRRTEERDGNDTIQGKERSARGAKAASSAGYARGAKAVSSAGYAIPRGALKALSTVSLHGPGRLYAMHLRVSESQT